MDNAEREYYERTRRMLEDPYLEADARGDIAGGSGSGGGLVRWERKRRVIASAFDRDGTWLDVGCANGLLMETLTQWCAAKGVRIEPCGLELSERISARARERLPHWADRIWTGNAMTWTPPMRFDYTTILPELVPGNRQADMLRRLLDVFLAPRGRLVLSCYRPGRLDQLDRPQAAVASVMLRECGLNPVGEAEVRDDDGSLWTSVAWVDRVR